MDKKKETILNAVTLEIKKVESLSKHLGTAVLLGAILTFMYYIIGLLTNEIFFVISAFVFWVVFLPLCLNLQDKLFQKKQRLLRLHFVESCM